MPVPAHYCVEGVKVTHTPHSCSHQPPSCNVSGFQWRSALTTGIRGAWPDAYLRANGSFLLQAEGSAHRTIGWHFLTDTAPCFTQAPGGRSRAPPGRAAQPFNWVTGQQEPSSVPPPSSPGYRELSSKLLPPANLAVQVQLFPTWRAPYFTPAGSFLLPGPLRLSLAL